MSTVTFGDVLDRARGHLDACAAVPDSALRGDSLTAAAEMTGRLAATLSRFLADFAPYSMAEAITSDDLDPQVRVAVVAREVLQLASASLRADDAAAGERWEGPAGVAAELEAAGTTLAAGRDLLGTHFTTSDSGARLVRTDWSVVIVSAPVTGALLDEVAQWVQQLGLLTARLSAAGAADAAVPAAVSQKLAEGCRGLLAAGAALATERGSRSAAGSDAELLHAIPAGFRPERRAPGDAETAGELAEGVAVSAARLRFIARDAADGATWSPAMTADSWRWTATGAAVICNVSEIMLTTLSRQPDQSRYGPAAVSQLVSAAQAAAGACDRWREVAAAWTDVTTETRGLTSPSIADTGDLVVRLGRLAFADPGWSPVRGRTAPVREIADLAPDGQQAADVVGAMHHAADALARVAIADVHAVRGALRRSRIHVPSRTLPERFDVPYRYWNITLRAEASLTAAYRAAVGASGRLAVAMDEVAVSMNAPSWIRAAARAAISSRETTQRDHTHDLPIGSAAASPADLEPLAPVAPGPVEQAVQRVGNTDMLLLMRARAMDAAAARLIAEALDGVLNASQRGQGQGARRSTPAARSEARVASASFPQGAGSRHGTGPAATAPKPSQIHSTLNTSSRPPARSTPKPAPPGRAPPPASGSAAIVVAPCRRPCATAATTDT